MFEHGQIAVFEGKYCQILEEDALTSSQGSYPRIKLSLPRDEVFMY